MSDPETANDVKVLVQLLLGSGLMTREEFARASELSQAESIPLIAAVKRNGLLTDESLRLSQEAQLKVLANEISTDLAIRALRVAMQRRLSLPDAVQSIQKLHQQTQVAISVTNELTGLLLAANYITSEQLGRFIKLSQDSGMMIGHLFMLDNKISVDELMNALEAVLRMREGEIDKAQAAQGLRFARQRHMSLQQALVELAFLKDDSPRKLRMGDLFLMAGLITKTDYAECYEIELFKKKTFGQILLERGLVTSQQAHAAARLATEVEEGRLPTYQAVEMLREVVKEGQPGFRWQ